MLKKNVSVYEHIYRCIFCFKFWNLKIWNVNGYFFKVSILIFSKKEIKNQNFGDVI
jgi:hypothetical protein